MSEPRTPEAIRKRLRDALLRAEHGPQHTDYAGQSEDYRRGREGEAAFQAEWRAAWLIPELREVLTYLESE